uniref:Inhibitor of growth protein N-terminal histone-binding domain-containing protein n=1 Tax=Parascaris univalens TaxID=6257 RepID=A0A915B4G6_PARUN
MSQFLEQYHKSVADLPAKLKENFDEIRRLDIECMTKATIIDKRMKEFIKNRKSLAKNEAEILHKEITALFAEMQRLSDQKIRLSSDAYELVDKHIRKLDDDAAKLRASLRQKFVDASGKITTDGGESDNEIKRRKSSNRKDKKKKEDVAVRSTLDTPGPSAVLQPFLDTTPIVEMPVDPNEPTYCICHQVC